MDVIKNLIERAQQNKQRIVLPEGTEERTLKAADKAVADGIAEIILLGNKEEILSLAQQHGLANIEKATIVDPCNNPDAEKYANLLFELRKAKGTYVFQGQWGFLDHIFVSPALKPQAEPQAKVAAFPFLVDKDGHPFRTFRGPYYAGGISDHLPLFVEVDF